MKSGPKSEHKISSPLQYKYKLNAYLDMPWKWSIVHCSRFVVTPPLDTAMFLIFYGFRKAIIIECVVGDEDIC